MEGPACGLPCDWPRGGTVLVGDPASTSEGRRLAVVARDVAAMPGRRRRALVPVISRSAPPPVVWRCTQAAVPKGPASGRKLRRIPLMTASSMLNGVSVWLSPRHRLAALWSLDES